MKNGHKQNTTDPLDPVALERLKQLRGVQKQEEPNILARLIDLFLDETPKRLHDAQDAYRDENLPELELLAHSMRGSCAILGLSAMVDICQEIETAAHNRVSSIPVKPHLDQLGQMLSAAQPWLIKERDSEQPEA